MTTSSERSAARSARESAARGSAARGSTVLGSTAPGSAAIERAWSCSSEELFAALGTSERGLSEDEARARLAAVGPNSLEARRPSPWRDALVGQLRNPLSWLLVFAAVVSSIAGEFTDAAVIALVLSLGAVLGAVQEVRASNAVEALKARVAQRAEVLRAGAPTSVLATSLVPGDVVVLGAGSLVPADGVVLEAKDLQVSESILTGETFPVDKRPGAVAEDTPLASRTNALHLGTSVRSGTGHMLVVGTGAHTEYGRIAHRLELSQPETDFDRGLRRFGYLLTRIMLVLVVFTFTATVLTHQPPIDSLLFAIALAVGLAPEMLPAIVAVNLARGAQRMAGRGVVVRRLSAIESFGSMDVLCTDKTGTLTEGEVVLDEALDVDGAPSARVLELAIVNATLEAGMPNALDEAIRRRAKEATPLEAWRKLDEIPYDFVRKRLGIVAESPAGEVLLVDKGALAKVVEVASQVRRGEALEPLDDAGREAILARGRALGERGMRAIGVATKVLPRQESYDLRTESELVFEGLLTFADPPKKGVRDVVADLARLGVAIKMVTGDSREVACHVAELVGIGTENVVTGRELASVRDEALWNLAEKTTIFAEVDPNQKERIILALGKTGHVVGYMGDGINDAPALHAADVSVSVDGAADVAREAANFVLLRRDLAVLRDGILEGRTTFANTMKYVFTTESANFGNMVSMAVASAFLPFLPLLATQVLLNNLLSDVPAVTLASDSVDPEHIERPQRWELRTLARFMISFGLISSAFDLLTFAGLYAWLGVRDAEFRTGWFVESLLTELAVALVVRTRRPAWKSQPSKALLGSSIAVALIALVLPYSPLASTFELVPMPPLVVVFLVVVTASYVTAVEAWKGVFFRRSGPSSLGSRGAS